MSNTSCSRNAARSSGDSRSSASSSAKERSSANFRGCVRRETFRIDHRLGKPGADIDFPLRFCASEPVETKPGDHGNEEGFRILYLPRAGEAQISVLHDIFRIAAAAEHAIGKPEQSAAIGCDRIAFMRLV